jgi:hypothetical protein
MLQTHLHEPSQSIKIMERSIYSAKHCFTKLLLHRSVLHHGMTKVLDMWYNFINVTYDFTPDVISK